MQKEASKEQAFVQYLRRRSESADLARMRRSLGEPGQAVIPVVEGFVGRIQSKYEDPWERLVYYLVSGLWATTVSSSDLEHFRKEVQEDQGELPDQDKPLSESYRRALGHAIAQLYLTRGQPKSIEQRFINLLDADEEQLPYRMRQMMQLLKTEEGIRVYWSELLNDLLKWNRERKPVQQKWARAFYRTVSQELNEGEEA